MHGEVVVVLCSGIEVTVAVLRLSVVGGCRAGSRAGATREGSSRVLPLEAMQELPGEHAGAAIKGRAGAAGERAGAARGHAGATRGAHGRRHRSLRRSRQGATRARAGIGEVRTDLAPAGGEAVQVGGEVDAGARGEETADAGRTSEATDKP
jgi:hypothetical protein